MLAVTGIGMVSPLGLDAVSSCGAARAGVCRITEIDDVLVEDAGGEETAPVSVHRVPLISAGFFGFARLLEIGSAALADLLRSTGSLHDSRVGFVLVVGGETYRNAWLELVRREPEQAGSKDIDADQAAVVASENRVSGELLSALLSRAGLTISERARKTICATAVGFVDALQQAQAWLAEGVCDRCVVGGVDSLLDPTTLEALDGLGLLKTPQNPVGLMPGEAACFLLVENQHRQVHQTGVRATLESPVAACGAPHPRLSGPDGARDALADTISLAFAALSDGGRSTGVLVVNLNGDPYRTSVWSDSMVRVLLPMQLGETPVWLPPLFFGDTGAATGFVSVALLAQGWARHYAAANALVCLTDDLGGRGAFYVRAPNVR